jgi:hypothetical protein
MDSGADAMNSTAINPQIPRTVRLGVTTLSVIGVAGFILTLFLGFEEPSSMLWPFGALTLAVPVGVLIHLVCTDTLTAERKHAWWTEFASSEIWSAISEYLTSDDLATAADRLASKAAARRGLRKA